MTLPFLFLLSALASFRLALMFSKEKGPGHVFKKTRESMPIRSKLRDGVECILCESVWWSGLIALYLGWLGEVDWEFTPLFWLASSATACIIHFQWKGEEPVPTDEKGKSK